MFQYTNENEPKWLYCDVEVKYKSNNTRTIEGVASAGTINKLNDAIYPIDAFGLGL